MVWARPIGDKIEESGINVCLLAFRYTNKSIASQCSAMKRLVQDKASLLLKIFGLEIKQKNYNKGDI